MGWSRRFSRWAHTRSTPLTHPSFSGLLVTCAYLPQTTFPPGVTRPSSLTFTSMMVPLVKTPREEYMGPFGFFFTPKISSWNVALSSGWVTCALVKRMKKSWKRMITKATFVGPGFTRKPPKYERFIRPSGLRFTKAHVTHPELKATFQLQILGVKKNPNGPMYSSLGVMTKGTVIEVSVEELGLVTPGG